MHTVITPQPHFIPGYVGHCPRYMFRSGGTYSRLTHNSLMSPCAGHARQLILMPLEAGAPMTSPTERELKTLKFRENFLDTVYRDPIIPGYDGFVPRIGAQIGKRFLAAAISGVAEHEDEMELRRCENRNLVHAGILEDSHGLFVPKMCERLMPTTKYRSPLVPVAPRSASSPAQDCSFTPKKEPYSKFTAPHFMENEDDQKWIVNGYAGHVPMARQRHGQSNKDLSRSALNDFSNNVRLRRLDAWCDSGQLQSLSNSSCPSNIDTKIYHENMGFIPNYAGHVPGHSFKIGLRYALSTSNAKKWLRDHKM